MNKHDQNSLAGLLGNTRMISELARSPDAQALISMLSKGNDPEKLEQMAKNAANGDTQSLKTLVQSITEDPESAQILRRLQETFQNK